jgi:hypothetical protein
MRIEIELRCILFPLIIPEMRWKELSVEVRHRSGEGRQKNNNSAALKFPKNTVASIVPKRRGFEPPRLFLERAAWPN